jgi:hypothetical protein
VLAAEHLFDLAALDLLIERVDGLREFSVDRFAGLRPLGQYGEVVALAAERGDQIAILLQTAAALEDFLRFGLVFPEIGRGGARLETRQFFFGTGGFKDSPANRRRAS